MTEGRIKPWLIDFFSKREGHLLIAGLLLGAGLLLQLALALAFKPDWGQALLVGLVAEVATGREGGVPLAIAEGAPPLLVTSQSVLQDLAGALIAYPFFLLALHHWYGADNYLMRRVRAIEEAADAHEAYVRRWGPLGLAVFMLIPFMVNGPLVALILGRLAGIRTNYSLPIIVPATIAVAAAWAYAFDVMLAFADSQVGWLGRAIAIAMIVIVAVLAAVDYVRERKQREREREKDAFKEAS